MYAKKSVSMKVVVLLLAVVLLIGCVAGGTLAWLITSTGPVENTFVAGEIGNLALKETDADKRFIIVPGVDISKDPTVTFDGNNVPAYLFVKIEYTGWNTTDGKTFTIGSDDKEMTWEIADGWTKLENGVYYRTVEADADTQATRSYGIIKNNTITVESGITKDDLAKDSEGNNAYTKSLTFTAYAIQAEGFVNDAEGTENGKTAAQKAWIAVQPANS